MYHFTSNDPTASGFQEVAKLIKASTEESKIWIKGHGTGTLDAGRMEATSLQESFPDSPLVSWKGSIGHTLGSCGIVELSIVIEAMKAGRCPGTVGTNKNTMASNVATDSFDISGYRSAALLSNAFGGAHAGCIISHA